jgi:hypothetical protein
LTRASQEQYILIDKGENSVNVFCKGENSADVIDKGCNFANVSYKAAYMHERGKGDKLQNTFTEFSPLSITFAEISPLSNIFEEFSSLSIIFAEFSPLSESESIFSENADSSKCESESTSYISDTCGSLSVSISSSDTVKCIVLDSPLSTEGESIPEVLEILHISEDDEGYAEVKDIEILKQNSPFPIEVSFSTNSFLESNVCSSLFSGNILISFFFI